MKVCPEHKVEILIRDGKFGPFYSHKNGEAWCNKKPEEVIELHDEVVHQIKASEEQPEIVREKLPTGGANNNGMLACNAMNNAIELVKAGQANYEDLNIVYKNILSILEEER